MALAPPRQRGSQGEGGFNRRASGKPLSRRLSRRLRYETGRPFPEAGCFKGSASPNPAGTAFEPPLALYPRPHPA